MKNIIYSFALIAITLFSFNFSYGTKGSEQKDNTAKPVITFIELGSVNCIPCKKMQSVMKAIEANYGDQVKVTFYDVWTEEQKPYAEKYKVRMIPTQVFLDTDGKEFFRHEGFYPETEIDKLLQSKGLKPVNKK